MMRYFSILILTVSLILLLGFSSFAGSNIRHETVKITTNSERSKLTFKPVFNLNKASVLKKGTLPITYDSRSEGVVTSVKDQGDNGSCWAFSAIACAETSVLKENKELSANTLDFSEAQHAYFTFSAVSDPLNMTGDKTEIKKSNFLDIGGNPFFSTFSFSKWFGVTDEMVAPYGTVDKTDTINKKYAAGSNAFVLENAIWYDSSDIDSVKQAVMNYGAVSVSYYYNEDYYNENTAAYYCNKSKDGNHQVTIVGWDDNFSVSNFGSANMTGGFLFKTYRPSEKGAWLVKNSFGSDYGKNGYFWLSYYDKSLIRDIACAYDFQDADMYDYNYQYDGSISFNDYYADDQIYSANVFKANGTERLQAISYVSIDDEADFYYNIYLNPKSITNPTSGTAVYSSFRKTNIKGNGYFTVKLPKELQLYKDEKFAVVILSKRVGEKCYCLCDYGGWLDNDYMVYSNTSSIKGQSLISQDGKTWEDLYDKRSFENCRIKAFTSRGYVIPEKIYANVSKPVLTQGESAVITTKATPFSASNACSFVSSDPSVAAITSKGQIVAKGVGLVKITAVSKVDKTKKATVTVKVRSKTPTGLKQTAATVNAVSFTWSKVTGAKYYKIEQYNASTKKWVTVSTVSTNKATVKALKSGIAYKFRVTALDGTKKVSSNASAALTTFTLCTAPSVKLSSTKSKTVTVRWSRVTGAISYKVYASYDGKKWAKAGTTTKTAYQINNLKGGKRIYVVVRATNTNRIDSALSSIRYVTVKK